MLLAPSRQDKEDFQISICGGRRARLHARACMRPTSCADCVRLRCAAAARAYFNFTSADAMTR